LLPAKRPQNIRDMPPTDWGEGWPPHAALAPRPRTKRKPIGASRTLSHPGCGQIPRRRAYVGAGRCRVVADAAFSRRQDGSNFLDHRWGDQAAAPARYIRIGSKASATKCAPPSPTSS
jgi:hypothetical protein